MKILNKKYIVKTWQELTEKEKEKAIQENSEQLYCDYDNSEWKDTEYCLIDLISNLKIIHFRDNDILKTISFDDNSQGWWIDRIKNFKYNADGIDVFGEHIDIYDVDFRIRKLIESFDIDIYDYYINSDKLDRIKATKKYQKWEENIKQDIEKWVDCVNSLCSDLGNSEYQYPYNMSDEEDKNFLDWYFEDIEFESIEYLERDSESDK